MSSAEGKYHRGYSLRTGKELWAERRKEELERVSSQGREGAGCRICRAGCQKHLIGNDGKIYA